MKNFFGFSYVNIRLLFLFLFVSIFLLFQSCKLNNKSKLSDTSQITDQYSSINITHPFRGEGKKKYSYEYSYKVVAKSEKPGCSYIGYPPGTSDNIYKFDVYERTGTEGMAGIGGNPEEADPAKVSVFDQLDFKNDCFPYTLQMSLALGQEDKGRTIYFGQTKIEKPSATSSALLVDISLEKTDKKEVSVSQSTYSLNSILNPECLPLQPIYSQVKSINNAKEEDSLLKNSSIKRQVIALGNNCTGRVDLIKPNVNQRIVTEYALTKKSNGISPDKIKDFYSMGTLSILGFFSKPIPSIIPDLWSNKIQRSAIYAGYKNEKGSKNKNENYWRWDKNDISISNWMFNGGSNFNDYGVQIFVKEIDDYVLTVQYAVY